MTTEEIARGYQIRRLGNGEIVSSFDCGDEDLNDFILNESVKYRQARLAVTYVIEVRNSNHVVGFFSLANDRVSLSLISKIKQISTAFAKHVSTMRKG